MNVVAPLLVVTRIIPGEPRPSAASAELRVAGRCCLMVIDLSEPTVVGFEQTPGELQYHCPAQGAVIELILRAVRGEEVVLPVDLSSVVRESNVPWPVPVVDEEDDASREVVLAQDGLWEVIETDAPGVLRVTADIEGINTVVLVDRSNGKNRPLRFRFVQGIHPWQLSPVKQRLLLFLLADNLPK